MNAGALRGSIACAALAGGHGGAVGRVGCLQGLGACTKVPATYPPLVPLEIGSASGVQGQHGVGCGRDATGLLVTGPTSPFPSQRDLLPVALVVAAALLEAPLWLFIKDRSMSAEIRGMVMAPAGSAQEKASRLQCSSCPCAGRARCRELFTKRIFLPS